MLKSHPVPHAGVPFQPILNHKCTIPSPFSFEERDKLAMSRKQEKIEEIFEEEKKVVQCTMSEAWECFAFIVSIF